MSSMLYTMGMALDRAAENGFPVSLLVEGHWVDGRVGANDGIGVVLEDKDGYHCVVRTERISAVRIHAESPYQAAYPDHPAGGSTTSLPAGELRSASRVGAAA